MTVRLAEPQREILPASAGRALPTMEKFVIEGGIPLSGTLVPAGNKNGALRDPRCLGC